MEQEEIKKLQKQIDKDDQAQPQSAEKRLKLKESFDEVLKKITRAKWPWALNRSRDYRKS